MRPLLIENADNDNISRLNSARKPSLPPSVSPPRAHRASGNHLAPFPSKCNVTGPSVPEAHLLDFEKLQHLAATEVPAVRDAACKQLSYYRQKCVETVAKP
ncbi:MAG: hypothetical protein IT577_05990 [Verrucomicrobiae bacterium]|nr:hypothetical protein [Verrucomicrobiae bacterium]